METDEDLNFSTALRTCTFVATHGEFTEQHWYNCYTCGLIWDKGCCSLCAQICHKGHDVGYSRKSSFFCDCGAEVRTSVGRISCKCLSPLSNSLLASIHNTKSIRDPNHHNEQKPSKAEENELWKETITVMSGHFREVAQKSIHDFVSSVNSTLICDLFDIFKAKFDSWLNKNLIQDFFSRTLGDISIPPIGSFIMSRDGVQLDLRKLADQSFSPVRMTTANSVSTNITSGTNAFKVKENLLTNIFERNVLIADSCGRMIVADSRCLLFIGALPLVNTRYISNPMENALQRSQLCVVGSHTVDFDVVGMSICQGRDRHVLVWGLTTVKCLVLGAGLDKVDISIDLSLELESGDFDFESDYIVKVEWVTGVSPMPFSVSVSKFF
jgi:E3 ubiquitin-protein ligase UBR4